MKVLIATAGALPAQPVACLVEALAGSDGWVTVMNVTQGPGRFPNELEDGLWQPFDDESPPGPTAGEADPYIQERGMKIVSPIVSALEGRNLEVGTLFVAAEDAADAILETADRLNAEIIVMGATRQLFKELSWTSVSMKVVAGSRLPVLLMPEPAEPVPLPEEDDDQVV
ncbi:MAG: universal stress protein [Acidimicrobiia bacterium]|nr:universal stress protein [bacterium]MXX64158.1 universal stress protein [Acidimicrobiia bacterium]MCY3580804.1 universal stress protein [bacterium]MCY3652969.1 universal stress protein [bacterium]MDE0642851.1 universal stress protein [bacterium]